MRSIGFVMIRFIYSIRYIYRVCSGKETESDKKWQ